MAEASLDKIWHSQKLIHEFKFLLHNLMENGEWMLMGRVSVGEDERKSSGDRWWWWLHNNVNMPNATELYT